MEISVEKIDLKSYKALIPAVSTGNVPQLALDLLICSTDARRIGSIWHEGILPIVGSDAFDSKSLSLTITTEIFVCEAQKLLFIQFRSPILKYAENNFKESFVQWLHKSGVIEIVIIASALDLKQYKSLVDEPDTVRFSAPENLDLSSVKMLKALNCINMESKEMDNLKEDQGTRFSLELLEYCNSLKLPSIFLLKYCFEGDTRIPATSYASFVDRIFEMLPQANNGEKRFKIPPSWEFMFGNDPPIELY